MACNNAKRGDDTCQYRHDPRDVRTGDLRARRAATVFRFPERDAGADPRRDIFRHGRAAHGNRSAAGKAVLRQSHRRAVGVQRRLGGHKRRGGAAVYGVNHDMDGKRSAHTRT